MRRSSGPGRNDHAAACAAARRRPRPARPATARAGGVAGRLSRCRSLAAPEAVELPAPMLLREDGMIRGEGADPIAAHITVAVRGDPGVSPGAAARIVG